MDKSILTSKTFYLGLITAIAPLFPSATDFLAENNEVVLGVIGLLIIILRSVTKTEIKATAKLALKDLAK